MLVQKDSRLAQRVAGLRIQQVGEELQFVHQVVNDQRQNRPAIKVRPGSDGACEETAEILEGLTRRIEYDSQAPAVYDTGFEHAVTTGRGYWP